MYKVISIVSDKDLKDFPMTVKVIIHYDNFKNEKSAIHYSLDHMDWMETDLTVKYDCFISEM